MTYGGRIVCTERVERHYGTVYDAWRDARKAFSRGATEWVQQKAIAGAFSTWYGSTFEIVARPSPTRRPDNAKSRLNPTGFARVPRKRNRYVVFSE
jgi:hypothetical protein